MGLDDAEVGVAVEHAPASAGGALLDLYGADVAFGLMEVNPMVRSVANRRILSWWPGDRRASRSPCVAIWRARASRGWPRS